MDLCKALSSTHQCHRVGVHKMRFNFSFFVSAHQLLANSNRLCAKVSELQCWKAFCYPLGYLRHLFINHIVESAIVASRQVRSSEMLDSETTVIYRRMQSQMLDDLLRLVFVRRILSCNGTWENPHRVPSDRTAELGRKPL
jgi:hypothetical protein